MRGPLHRRASAAILVLLLTGGAWTASHAAGSRATLVVIEVQQANVGCGTSNPIEDGLVIVNPVLRQMPVEPDQRD